MLKRLTAPLRSYLNTRFESLAGEIRALREETARSGGTAADHDADEVMAATALLARKVDRMADGIEVLVARAPAGALAQVRASEIAFASSGIGGLPRGSSVLTSGLPGPEAAGLAALGYRVTAVQTVPTPGVEAATSLDAAEGAEVDALVLLSAGDLLGLGGVDLPPEVGPGRAALAVAAARLRPGGTLVLTTRGSRPLPADGTGWLEAVLAGWIVEDAGTLREHDGSWSWVEGVTTVDPQDVALVRARKPVT